MHNRLRNNLAKPAGRRVLTGFSGFQLSFAHLHGKTAMRKPLEFLLVAALFSAFSLSCNNQSNTLAPYVGARGLRMVTVTQNFTPDIQWLGGRVAAVGVNRGTRASMDSTLVWLMDAPTDSITYKSSSYVTYGSVTDKSKIQSLGGTYQDSLNNEATYTFWIATTDAFNANLDSSSRTEFSFADTTLSMQLYLRGTAGGETDSQGNLATTLAILHEQTLLSDKYVIEWTPATHAYRRIGINAASFGSFTNLVWHVVTPDSVPDNIVSPVVIGVPPPGTQEAVPWSGFQKGQVYMVWMVDSTWNGSFAPSSQGYAWYRIFAF